MNKTTLTLFALAAAPVFGQIVYVNDPSVPRSSVLINPNGDAATFKYRIKNETGVGGTDFLIGDGLGSLVGGAPAGSQIGWNAGGIGSGVAGNPKLTGTEVTFLIQNTPGQGLAFYAQFAATVSGSPTTRTGVVGWGSFTDPINTIPAGLIGAGTTIPSPRVISVPTLLPSGSGATSTTPLFAYDSLGVTFALRAKGGGSESGTITWNSLAFSGSGLSVSGSGFTSGSLTSAALPQGSAQYAFSQTDLSNVNWQMYGKVTLSGNVPADGIQMNLATLHTSFTPVPEPSEYMAAVGGVALFGGLLLRRRRTEP